MPTWTFTQHSIREPGKWPNRQMGWWGRSRRCGLVYISQVRSHLSRVSEPATAETASEVSWSACRACVPKCWPTCFQSHAQRAKLKHRMNRRLMGQKRKENTERNILKISQGEWWGIAWNMDMNFFMLFEFIRLCISFVIVNNFTNIIWNLRLSFKC